MTLLDTNVLLDIAAADPIWLDCSEREFRSALALGPIPINPIIYAELAPAFAMVEELDDGWIYMLFNGFHCLMLKSHSK